MHTSTMPSIVAFLLSTLQAEFENPLLENMSICGILDKCVKQKRPLIYNDERIFLWNPIKKGKCQLFYSQFYRWVRFYLIHYCCGSPVFFLIFMCLLCVVALLDAKQNGSSDGLEPCYAYHGSYV